MPWLSFDWIALNWTPLLITLAIGFVLGWLFTGAPAGRRARELEAATIDLDARARKADRDLAESRKESEARQARLLAATADVDAARSRTGDLETRIEQLGAEKQTLEEVVAEAAHALGVARAELEAQAAANPSDAALAEEFAAVARTPEALLSPSHKDIALDEAFGRAATLQHELGERDAILSMRQAELELLKSELLTSNAARRELEARLVRAREDVAAELAVFASTMIKMKDDALQRAEARNAALTTEVESLRQATERATQTAD